jgi:antitoxin component of MazEF toxin-antitoxin module
MTIKLTAIVTPEGKLEIPSEILKQLQPLTEYDISLTENEIKLTKTKKKLTLDELWQRVDEVGPDPEQPSLAEISQVVKEVRQELWGNP